MSIKIGPILYARAVRDGDQHWPFALQVTVDDPSAEQPGVRPIFSEEDIQVHGPALAADLFNVNGWRVWRWEISVPRMDAERWVTYSMSDDMANATPWRVAIPARGHLPRAAMFSCSGFMHASDLRGIKDPQRMWKRMGDLHETAAQQPTPDNPSGLHLIVGAGDQVYCDELPAFNHLDHMSSDDRARLTRSDECARTFTEQYLARYQSVWHDNPSIAAVLAQVPGVFTWDDHDILDGWGSRSADVQDNVGYQQAFEAARRAYVALQLGGDLIGGEPPLIRRGIAANPGDGVDHLMQWLSFRESDRWLDIILPDTRSHRTHTRVMPPAEWADWKAAADQYAAESASGGQVTRHVWFISPVPVVYLRFPDTNTVFESLSDVLHVDDDMLDQWEHSAHSGERARLIMSLLELRRRANAQVTILIRRHPRRCGRADCFHARRASARSGGGGRDQRDHVVADRQPANGRVENARP